MAIVRNIVVGVERLCFDRPTKFAVETKGILQMPARCAQTAAQGNLPPV
jgi:hypothetical protein